MNLINSPEEGAGGRKAGSADHILSPGPLVVRVKGWLMELVAASLTSTRGLD